MNLSLMSCHMILVISSPSSSTTGFLTLILGICWLAMFLRCTSFAAIGRGNDRWTVETGLAKVDDAAAVNDEARALSDARRVAMFPRETEFEGSCKMGYGYVLRQELAVMDRGCGKLCSMTREPLRGPRNPGSRGRDKLFSALSAKESPCMINPPSRGEACE